ncbi:MAG: DUF3857 domain-containing transglutaminase family protein [Bacteroidota bacterium]
MINGVFHFLLVLLFAFKPEPRYPVDAIDPQLKAGMYAVIRDQKVQIEINSLTNASIYYYKAITILSPAAKNYAVETVWYDPFHTIKSFKGTVYDAAGGVIKKLKASDILDRSYFDNASMFTDNRIKEADLMQSQYPYTVEFEYEIAKKSNYSLPDFYLYLDDEVSIEHSSFSIKSSPELMPRYHSFKLPDPVIEITADNKNQISWRFANVLPEKFEKNAPDITRTVPNILLAPNEFEYDGYAGRMDSWVNLGLWQKSLNDGRDDLPEETKRKVRELVEPIISLEEKVKAVYGYVQSRTRYVGVQLGIGGWQPIPAKVVDEVGYGDCKGLSNYTIALLKAAGIKSYYTKVNAGIDAPQVHSAFPSPQFNHVIVAVPNEADTIWLECTSQTNPFGYLGTFTGDRKALLINEHGGTLVNTTRYTDKENQLRHSAEISLDESGNAITHLHSIYSGIFYERNNLDFAINKGYEEQKRWIQNNIPIPAFNISHFKMELQENRVPKVNLTIELELKGFGSITGSMLIFNPNLTNKSSFLPPKQSERKNLIVQPYNQVETDSLIYSLPKDFHVEFLPSPVTIESDFGKYEASFLHTNASLIYIRKLRVRKGDFLPVKYPEYVDFYRSVQKADNIKIILLNKT